MTNIEKVKRILDAGHRVRITFTKGRCAGDTCIITSYSKCNFSYITKGDTVLSTIEPKLIKDCTIEVIQRIPTAYKAGDKVLVLSNPRPDRSNSEYVDEMVGKICEVKNTDSFNYKVWDEDKTDYWILPPSCLAPAFDDEPTLSGKEVTVTIDGKEYTAVIK